MKTLYKFFLLCFIAMAFQANAQMINVNPDPNGEPWWSGGAVAPEPGAWSDATELAPTPESYALTLPAYVYNNDLPYFPGIYLQKGQSCVQVAEIWYAFTYEINRKRNLDASDVANQYNALYTYNFLNGGSGNSFTYFKDGFNIVKQNGCPSWNVFDDPVLHDNYHPDKWFKYWMTGHDKYKAGMYNTIDTIYYVQYTTFPNWFTNIKHWIADHGSGAANGGLAVIGVMTNGWQPTAVIPSNSPRHAGDLYISAFGTSSGHALTIVGYDDDIYITDIDGEDGYTNDHDVNGDGVFNIKDFEKGAFKVANSWPDFGNYGFIWVPYKLFYSGNPGFAISYAYGCSVFEGNDPIPTPDITMKFSIDYPSRDKLRDSIAYGQYANSDPSNFSAFLPINHSGGPFKMRGVYDGPIQIGANFSSISGYSDFGKIFFKLIENDAGNSYTGTINQFSIIDHRWGEDFELDCGLTNVPILNGANQLSIEYDLIPHEQPITTPLTFNSNMVSRFSPRVSNHNTLTVNDRVTIDMYNSKLIIDEGSTLVIGNQVRFHAKRGVSKIIINGNVQIGTSVTFTADEGSTIELYLNNQPVNISGCEFINCKIKSIVNPLTISACSFTKSYIEQSVTNLSISGSGFLNSSVLVSNPTMGPIQINNSVTITDCHFTTAFYDANSIIEVYGYKNFEITYNTIDNVNNPQNTYHGISLHYSGSNQPGTTHEISNNEIKRSNSLSDNNISGITIYSSIADIKANYVHANRIGIQSLGYSEVIILGNDSAGNETETQRIKSNLLYQVFASCHAFPTQMNWNAIYSDNNTDCFVYHDVDMSANTPKVDVKNNYWGPVFDTNVNLCPIRHYKYDPIWNLTKNQITPSNVQQLFETGVSQIADSNYSDAKSTFQLVVTTYPEEEPATSALKEILYLEPLAGNNFEGLKNWYLTEPAILNHTQLFKLSQNLANKCNEKLEKYPDAIEWYENIIENPETLEDSIFAIIDLEHLYWQMGIDTTLRSASYVGRLGIFKPKSFKAFEDHKDELLSLLYNGQLNSSEDEEIEYFDHEITMNGVLGRNFPNPFNETTQIPYHLLVASDVKLNIYNYTGQLIKSIEEGPKTKGTHVVLFDANDLKSGIYFYSININGQTTDSKKMTIIR